MAPERRGPKLLGNLQGEAFEKMEYLDPLKLKVANGVELFKKDMQRRSEPLENHRVGKIMDSFLFDFSRKGDEQIADYDDRFHKELREVARCLGHLLSSGNHTCTCAKCGSEMTRRARS